MELVLDQRITTRLSLAISLFDDFTNKRISENVKVSIIDLNNEAVINPSGYFNFLDLPDGVYTLQVNSDYYIDNVIENLLIPRIFLYQFLSGTGAITGSTQAVLSDKNGLLHGDVLEFNNGSDLPERRIITLDPDPLMNKIYWENDPLGGLLNNYNDSDTLNIPIPERLIVPVRLIPDNLYPFQNGTTLVRGNVLSTEGNPIPKALVELQGTNFKTKTSFNGEFVIYFPASQQDALINIKVTPVGEIPKTISCEVKKGKVVSLSIVYP